MPDLIAPGRNDKLQCIEDMGIRWRFDCPSKLGLKDHHVSSDDIDKVCGGCWIKALEGKDNGSNDNR